ncbi:AraC family transcriptional regulator ligand-binding domain-containing protein [Hahella sp. SMD15-11]|uniref:AraC family transcriptional regulator ligand-binding domain-containing protein n=1 Tax=Thermohahella caldifontis TaxID=3142973 RepID=A0AB39UXR8_9GAMM
MVSDDIYARLLMAVLGREGPVIPSDRLQSISGSGSDPESLARQFLNLVYSLHPDTDLGLRYGHHLHPAGLCDFARALYTAPDIRSSLQLLTRMSFARGHCFSLFTREEGGRVWVFLTFPHQFPLHDGVRRFHMEATFSFALNGLQAMLGNWPEDVRITLPCAPPRYQRLFVRHWPLAPEFNAPAAALSFPARYLKAPVISRDDALHAVSLERAEQHWQAQMRAANFSYRATDAMIRHHPELLHATALATHLNMSVRTLQKHLVRCHDTFQHMLTRVRRELWAVYAGLLNLPAEDVSELLGFGSVSGYRRFCRTFSPSGHPVRLAQS